MALTKKQQAFVEHYLREWNATRAAVLAGYSEKTARSIGSENLKKSEVRRVIEQRAPTALEKRRQVYKQETRVKVYLIRAENGLIKIGKSMDVERRFRTLVSLSPVELELLCYFDTLFGDELEEELHAIYEEKRVRGEWFALTKSDVEDIIRRYGPANY